MWFKKKPKANRTLRLWAAGTYVAMVFVNILAELVPINGNTTAQVSDKFTTLFAPAGFTFGIWPVIYILLGAYTLYQLGFFREKKQLLDEGILNNVSKYFMWSSLINIAWVFAWHYRMIWLSLIIIVALAATVALLIHELQGRETTGRETLLVRTPFSVYLGWLTVASFANAMAWLVSMQWDGWGRDESFWTVVAVIITALVALVVTRFSQDYVYGLAVVWGFFGILAKQVNDAGWDGQYPAIIATLSALTAVLVLEISLIVAHRYSSSLNEMLIGK